MYPGMQVHQWEHHTWILMGTYIQNMQVTRNMGSCKPTYVPMAKGARGIIDMKELSARVLRVVHRVRVWFRTPGPRLVWIEGTCRLLGTRKRFEGLPQ